MGRKNQSILIIWLGVQAIAVLAGLAIIYKLLEELQVAISLNMHFENNDVPITKAIWHGAIGCVAALLYIPAYYLLTAFIPRTFPEKSFNAITFLYVAVGMWLIKLATWAIVGVAAYKSSASIWYFLAIYSLFFFVLIAVVIQGLKMRNYVPSKKKSG